MPLIFSAYAIKYVVIMIALVFGIHMIMFISKKNGTKFNRRVKGNIAKQDSKLKPVKIDEQNVRESIDDLCKKLNDQNVVDETYDVPLAGYIALGEYDSYNHFFYYGDNLNLVGVPPLVRVSDFYDLFDYDISLRVGKL